MVEKFLVDLFRRVQKRKIGIIIDGNVVDQKLIAELPKLTERLRELGDIKIAEVIYETKLSNTEYENVIESGFTNKIVAGNLELNLLLDTYDMVLSDNSVDIIVICTQRDSLIPLFTELRKSVTTFALVKDRNRVSKAFLESFDGLIDLDKIDEFTLNEPDLSEIESIISQSNGQDDAEDYLLTDAGIDANIGIVSEDLEEQSYVFEDIGIDELKKAERDQKLTQDKSKSNKVKKAKRVLKPAKEKLKMKSKKVTKKETSKKLTSKKSTKRKKPANKKRTET
ncbi:MAG: hypothetical protein IH840_04265 [Candidatus Heimdallarchaeota archaeon]|nr:hypothetical protein [Candidatus Heimdallarchaeota archaeon]